MWCKYCVFVLIFTNFNIGSSLEKLRVLKWDFSNKNREEVIITKISSENKFEYGQNVSEWKSIHIQNFTYALGLKKNGLNILKIGTNETTDELNVESNVIETTATILDATFFKFWNGTNKNYEVFIVGALSTNDIVWYRLTQKLSLETIWKWSAIIKSIRVYIANYEKNNFLFLIQADSNGNTLICYEFDIHMKKFWLMQQNIPLESVPRSIAFTTLGQKFILAVPQTKSGVLKLYFLNTNHFEEMADLHSNDITYVITFEQGHKPLLAIDGENSGIFEITTRGFKKIEISHSAFKKIYYWLPIQINNYRGDNILFVQSSAEYQTHSSQTIQAISFNGEKFLLQDEVMCNFYGEQSHGVGCLAEREPSQGIIGSTVVKTRNFLGLLIPHQHYLHSSLFRIETHLRKIPSPREEILGELKKQKQEITELLETLRKEKLHQKLEAASQIAESQSKTSRKGKSKSFQDEGIDDRAVSETFDLLEKRIRNMESALPDIQEKINKGIDVKSKTLTVKSLTVNGPTEMLGATLSTSFTSPKVNGHVWEELARDVVRSNKVERITGKKILKEVTTEKLEFEFVNGIRSDNFISLEEKPIVFSGNIAIKSPVVVENINSKIVNNVTNFEKLVVQSGMEGYNDTLEFDNLIISDTFQTKMLNNLQIHNNYVDTKTKIDSYLLKQNAFITEINRENLEFFLNNIYWKSRDNQFPGDTIINGTISVNKIETGYLNDVPFPEDYVTSTSEETVDISGYKNFTNNFTCNYISINSNMNGVPINSYVTRNTIQNIPSSLTMRDLEVTETLNFRNLSGPHVENYLPNPTLLQTNEIHSNLNFQNELEVVGDVIILDGFNNVNFQEFVGEVVYENADEVTISAPKEFSRGLVVENGLQVDSNLVNNIPIEKFVTADTEQTLIFQTLNGDVEIDNLEIGKLFASFNITKLESDTIRTDGQQYVSGRYSFSDTIRTDNIIVTNNLNGIPVDQLSAVNINFPKTVTFDKLMVKSIDVQGNFMGDLHDIDLEDFDEKRLSLSRPQKLTLPIKISRIFAENLEVDLINDIKSEVFDVGFHELETINKFKDGKLFVGNTEIVGNLRLASINGFPTEELLRGCMSDSTDSSHLLFKGNVSFDHLLFDNLNGVNMDEYFSSVVYKNETQVSFSDYKVFENGFKVARYIESQYLNNVRISNILTKYGKQEINANFLVKGNMFINSDTFMKGAFNGVHLHQIGFNSFGDTYKVSRDVVFESKPNTIKLNIWGLVNGWNLDDILRNVVYKEVMSEIVAPTTFLSEVNIGGHLAVMGTINKKNLEKFKKDVVFTSHDLSVAGIVEFDQSITIKNSLNLKNDIMVDTLMGINLDYWLSNAIFINKGKIDGRLSFSNAVLHNNISTEFVNNRNMSNVVLLKLPLHFDRTLRVQNLTLTHDVIVSGATNSYFLGNLYKNTVMKTGDNEILTPVQFKNNVTANSTIDASRTINKISFGQIVTTKSDQVLNATYKFLNKTIISGNMEFGNLLNGINFTNWRNNCLMVEANKMQNVKSPLNTTGDIVFNDDIDGEMLVDIDVRILDDIVEGKGKIKEETEDFITNEYMKVCKNVSDLMSITSSQVYLFDYFEEIQLLKFKNKIRQVYAFQYLENYFLLVNQENSCWSDIYRYEDNSFEFHININTGYIDQIIHTMINSSIFLIIRSNTIQVSDCDKPGVTVWNVEKWKPVFTIDHIVLKESALQGTFYGKTPEGVNEYRLNLNESKLQLKIYRQWNITGENLIFVPKRLRRNLALTDGKRVYKLLRIEPALKNSSDIIQGEVQEDSNLNFLNFGEETEVVTFNVGPKKQKVLTAITDYEDATIKSQTGVIKIYDDILEEKLYQKLPTHKISSLTPVEFRDNEETLLLFLQDKGGLEIYQYEGIFGFKKRSSIKIEASKLIKIEVLQDGNEEILIGAVNRNELRILKAVMVGNRFKEDLSCH